MMNLNVKIKLAPGAVMPKYARPGDAGMDLTATSRIVDEEGNVVYGTGVYMEIPEGYVGLLFPRSSICNQDLTLSNSVGILDSSYRGEIMFKFKPALSIWDENATTPYKADWDATTQNVGTPYPDEFNLYSVGDRIGQLIIMPYPQVEFTQVEELSTTERGDGGYGSTN